MLFFWEIPLWYISHLLDHFAMTLEHRSGFPFLSPLLFFLLHPSSFLLYFPQISEVRFGKQISQRPARFSPKRNSNAALSSASFLFPRLLFFPFLICLDLSILHHPSLSTSIFHSFFSFIPPWSGEVMPLKTNIPKLHLFFLSLTKKKNLSITISDHLLFGELTVYKRESDERPKRRNWLRE